MCLIRKQVSKYVVMTFFSNNASMLSFVLTGHGFMLPCICFVYLVLIDHSMPYYARPGQQSVARLLHGAEEPRARYVVISSYKICDLALSLLTLISTVQSQYSHLNYQLTTREIMNVTIKLLLSQHTSFHSFLASVALSFQGRITCDMQVNSRYLPAIITSTCA